MLRKIRVILAVLSITLLTLLFLDFTGTVQTYFHWLAHIQFLPALFAGNVLIVVGLILITLLFGRIYCSVVCPLGIMQDLFAWIGRRPKGRKFHYTYSKPKTWIRVCTLCLFCSCVLFGVASIVALLAPYSAFGRIVHTILQPLYIYANNGLASIAEHFDSYAFYSVQVWIASFATLIVAVVTLALLAILAYRNGRTYCNTICPVGTILGYISQISLFKITINTNKCNNCGLCSKSCKASCIDGLHHKIDYSRCVDCFSCIKVCKHKAIKFRYSLVKAENKEKEVDNSRRKFLATVGVLATTAVAKAEEKIVDGGLATILDKKEPNRKTPIVPFGAKSLSHLTDRCTGCQLCVSVCPNNVLRPSTHLLTLMQPRLSYQNGYCRPECTKCSQVCPAGAILKITPEQKSSIQVGHAVWHRKNCIVFTDKVSCGNCARHCPTGAITMVHSRVNDKNSPMIPVVNEERCIGCGACENLCPARPFSAIYVEGHEVHKTI